MIEHGSLPLFSFPSVSLFIIFLLHSEVPLSPSLLTSTPTLAILKLSSILEAQINWRKFEKD
ncbi:hypothetical protein E1A91_D04G128400v1 [Gossypium mustelinum]|uniref:Uncharacterized protein n=1 Tax=Gossypium mustelinum TaxID=34275 RepID=A0A5D2VD96_GOSMU|nr:hypothetical protein E1A91_D04G128400v1 [Gossypium mustelinum]